MGVDISLLPLGDTGVIAQCGGDEISEAASAAVHALRSLAERRRPPAVVEVIPTYRSLLVLYDPVRATAGEVRRFLRAVAAQANPEEPAPGRLIEIPAAYGGPYGPDLPHVAREAGISESQVVALHTGREYRVYMLGFVPGFPYMGTLPPPLRVSRLRSPRLRVPERSVAIAGPQTAIYSVESPGGWRVIGRTPLRPYDPSRANPFLFDAGDRVRFVAISAADYTHCAASEDPIPVPPLASRPALQVEVGGLLTTIQDLGRSGYRRFGLPQSGAMDSLALRLTNLLLGNSPGAAALEFTAPGPRLRAVRPVAIALGGADHAPALNGRPLPMWSAFKLRAGDVLAFGAPRFGQWGYIALPGGVDVPAVMGSRSTYLRAKLGGYGGRRLQAGDRIGCARPDEAALLRLAAPLRPRIGGPVVARIVLGPERAYFTEEAVAALLGEAFHASAEIDRAGYRLSGPCLAHRRNAEMLSDGLLPGALQVPAAGQPIVIMADGPTSGGYPKIGAVVRSDLGKIAQARRNEAIRFRAVDWDAAHVASREEAAYLAALHFERADVV
jgi:KipI family sensor histidine kinase inhibitor